MHGPIDESIEVLLVVVEAFIPGENKCALLSG